jgi:hypothetical protein
VQNGDEESNLFQEKTPDWLCFPSYMYHDDDGDNDDDYYLFNSVNQYILMKNIYMKVDKLPSIKLKSVDLW